MINLRLDGAVRTLILTLRARAEEQKQDEPLIRDPWSADWYAFMPDSKKLDEWYNPNFQLATAIRSRLIDEAVEAFVESHDNPVVVELGAGFSTRYFRIGEGKSTWIELDLDEAISARRKLDIEIDNHWFISTDMRETDWMNLLPDVDAKNMIFIAEGALMFLEPEAVDRLIGTLADRFSGANFVFDVINPGYLERANETTPDINAPMLWGVDVDELSRYNLSIDETRYLLMEHPERWEAIGVEKKNRKKDRSGYVVAARLS